MILIASLLFSASLFARENAWKDRLYCYGTFTSSSKFTVELMRSNDNDGVSREVYFARNVNREQKLVTNLCSIEEGFLICKSSDVLIKVNIASRYGHRGLWDAASYSYYEAEVTRSGFFSSKTEKIRCRI